MGNPRPFPVIRNQRRAGCCSFPAMPYRKPAADQSASSPMASRTYSRDARGRFASGGGGGGGGGSRKGGSATFRQKQAAKLASQRGQVGRLGSATKAAMAKLRAAKAKAGENPTAGQRAAITKASRQAAAMVQAGRKRIKPGSGKKSKNPNPTKLDSRAFAQRIGRAHETGQRRYLNEFDRNNAAAGKKYTRGQADKLNASSNARYDRSAKTAAKAKEFYNKYGDSAFFGSRPTKGGKSKTKGGVIRRKKR